MIFWSCNCIYKFCKLAILQTFLSEIEEGIQNQSDCSYFMVFGSKIEILWINMHKKNLENFVVDIHLQVEAQLDTLVNEQAAMVLNRVGLAEAYKMVQAYQPKQVMQGTIT